MGRWQETTIGMLANSGFLEFGDGYRTKRSELGIPGIPILRVAEILDGRIAPKFEDHVSDCFRPAMGDKISQTGDVILTTKGTIGRVATIPNGATKFVYSPQLCYFRIKSDGPLCARYLYYWFKSHYFWSQARRFKGQTDMADYINLADIRSLLIEIPPKSRQAVIVAALGALDDKIAVNERISRTARALARAYYAKAVAGGTTTVTVGEIAEVFDGPHATPKKTESGPWFLSISSLNSGRVALSESAHLAECDFERWTRRVTPQAGDVLFSYETRLGEAALMPRGIRACLGRRMALLRARPDAVGSRTLLQAFLSRSFQDTIRQRAVHGATVDRIPLTELPSWPIDLPDHGIGQLENSLGSFDDLASHRERENETLAELRDTLLPRLMSGELQVREAEDIVGDAV